MEALVGATEVRADGGYTASSASASSAPAQVASRAAGGVGPNGASDYAFAALEELQEAHISASRERSAFKQQRAELSSRLTTCEHELWAEEQIGRDLAQRIATLEAAIQRERVQYESYLKASSSSSSADSAAATGQGAEGASLEPASPGTMPPQHEAAWQILAAYMERFPQSRERSCRSLLVDRLQQAGTEEATELLRGGSPRGGKTIAPSSSSTAPGLRSGDLQGALWDEPGAEMPGCQTWRRQWTLRSHLDGARSVCCDQTASLLVSCGEDCLVKGWDLGPLWRGAPQTDGLEPYITLRGHTAPVLALSYRPQDRTLFSGGMDGAIRAWHLPETSAYSAYSANTGVQRGSICLGQLLGHRDSVWSLEKHPQLPYLASASADGSIGLWAAEAEGLTHQACAMEASLVVSTAMDESSEATETELESPSCVAWVQTDVTKVLSGYTSSRVVLFDARRESQVLDLFPGRSSSSPSTEKTHRAVTSACCHQVQQFAITGHADKCVRLVDFNSGRFVSTLGDHSDVVTSVCIDQAKGYYLVTGCHDGCARIFDLRTGRCCQRLHLHESKYNESMHCAMVFQKMLATAGADGSVVVMLQD